MSISSRICKTTYTSCFYCYLVRGNDKVSKFYGNNSTVNQGCHLLKRHGLLLKDIPYLFPLMTQKILLAICAIFLSQKICNCTKCSYVIVKEFLIYSVNR